MTPCRHGDSARCQGERWYWHSEQFLSGSCLPGMECVGECGCHGISWPGHSRSGTPITIFQHVVIVSSQQHAFIHSGYFYSASSSTLLFRGAPEYSIIYCVGVYMPKHNRQLWVKDLHKVTMWQLEQDSNLQHLALNLPMSHHVPHNQMMMNATFLWTKTTSHDQWETAVLSVLVHAYIHNLCFISPYNFTLCAKWKRVLSAV